MNTISSTGTNFAYEIAFGEDSPYQSQVEHLQWLKERRYQLMLNLRPSDQEIARYNYFEQHHALLSGQVVELENNIDILIGALGSISKARDGLQPYINAEWLDNGFFYELVTLEAHSKDLIAQLDMFENLFKVDALDETISLESRSDFLDQWVSSNEAAIAEFTSLYDDVFVPVDFEENVLLHPENGKAFAVQTLEAMVVAMENDPSALSLILDVTDFVERLGPEFDPGVGGNGQQEQDVIYSSVDTSQVFGDSDPNDIVGSEGTDYIFSREGDDVVNGSSGNDFLWGEGGNDDLKGAQGDDFIYGGKGDDSLQGGGGNDYLFGGEGDDTYHYNTGDGKDYISDVDGNDKIVINGNQITDVRQIEEGTAHYIDDFGNSYFLDGFGDLIISVFDGTESGTVTLGQFNQVTNIYGITLEGPESTELPILPTGLYEVGTGYFDDPNEDPDPFVYNNYHQRETYQSVLNEQGLTVDLSLITSLWDYNAAYDEVRNESFSPFYSHIGEVGYLQLYFDGRKKGVKAL